MPAEPAQRPAGNRSQARAARRQRRPDPDPCVARGQPSPEPSSVHGTRSVPTRRPAGRYTPRRWRVRRRRLRVEPRTERRRGPGLHGPDRAAGARRLRQLGLAERRRVKLRRGLDPQGRRKPATRSSTSRCRRYHPAASSSRHASACTPPPPRTAARSTPCASRAPGARPGSTWANQPPTDGAAAATESGLDVREWDVLAQTLAMFSSGGHGFLIRDSASNGAGGAVVPQPGEGATGRPSSCSSSTIPTRRRRRATAPRRRR